MKEKKSVLRLVTGGRGERKNDTGGDKGRGRRMESGWGQRKNNFHSLIKKKNRTFFKNNF